MGYAVKVTTEVRIDDFHAAFQQSLLDRIHCLVRTALGAVCIAVGMTVGFQYRHKHYCHRRLYHSIFHGWDPQWPQLSLAFGDVNPKKSS